MSVPSPIPSPLPSRPLSLPVIRLPHGHDLELPSYATTGSAGMDLRAAIEETQPILLRPLMRTLIPTGLSIELPHGFEAQIRPRSGLALTYGISCLNTPGTIDSDYRGEVKVLLINFGQEDFLIKRGMKIAQMIIAPIIQMVPVETKILSTTTRAGNGFGSTGQ